MSQTNTILCLASDIRGNEFIKECKKQGFCVALIVKEKVYSDPYWPNDCLDVIKTFSNKSSSDQILQIVDEVAQHHKIYRVIGLDELDIINAAIVRQHLCIQGTDITTAYRFRDKLTMRTEAQKLGINIPQFTHLLNHNELASYLEHVSPPWVIKPRLDAASVGIKKVESKEQVWEIVKQLDSREATNERTPYHLIEQYIAGDIYHVDSLIYKKKVIFAGVHKYGRPLINIAQEGGPFITSNIKYNSQEYKNLLNINRKIISGFELECGVTHAEFIKDAQEGKFYFLEIACRVGGACIADVIEASSEINIWREWAKIETTENSYQLPNISKYYAGTVLSLAKQEVPDTVAYNDPEITYRLNKHHHAGLIIRSAKFQRIQELLENYKNRFQEDFCAFHPPRERLE